MKHVTNMSCCTLQSSISAAMHVISFGKTTKTDQILNIQKSAPIFPHGRAVVCHSGEWWAQYIEVERLFYTILSSCCCLTWSDFTQTESFYGPPCAHPRPCYDVIVDSCFSTWHTLPANCMESPTSATVCLRAGGNLCECQYKMPDNI